MVRSDDYLKSRFETDDSPDSNDFADFIDSKSHVNHTHDYASSEQGRKADSAIQGVKLGDSVLVPDANKVISLPEYPKELPAKGGDANSVGGVTADKFSKDGHQHKYSDLLDLPQGGTSSGAVSKANPFTDIYVEVSGEGAGAVSIAIPPLKYNKKFVFIFCSDDGFKGIYTYLQRWLHGRYVETGYTEQSGTYWHLGMPRVSGEFAKPVPLSTDGCGNDIHFNVESAFMTTNAGGTDLHNFNTPQHSAYIQWNEVKEFDEFGGGLNNHQFGQDGFNTIYQLTKNQDKMTSKMNRFMTCMNRPNGDNSYLEAMKYLDFLIAGTVEGAGATVTDFINPVVENKFIVSRTSVENMTAEQIKVLIGNAYEQSTNGNRPVVYCFTHAVGPLSFPKYKEVFDFINVSYGKSGNDSVLVTTYEDLAQYQFYRAFSTIEEIFTSSAKKIFKISIPANVYFNKKEISLLLSGSAGLSVSVKGGYYGCFINQGLININFDSNSLALAEKYVALLEANAAGSMVSEYLNDANFFVSKLSGYYRDFFKARMDVFSSVPVLTSVSVNNGNETTGSTIVSVLINKTGTVTHYMLSETADFTGASWLAYPQSSDTVSFSFTNNTVETKTVYCKLKNDSGESGVVNDSISYIGAVLSLDSVSINSGDAVTLNAAVNVLVNYSNSVPTHYKISENSDLSGVSWLAWGTNPVSFNLSGTGVKTVYLQIKDANTVSSVVSDTITYSNISLTSISINGNASSTQNQTVEVAVNFLGAPAQYMISESSGFLGASWQVWTGVSGSAVNFMLSSGAGNKTVYVKLKDELGIESNTSSDVIQYNPPTTAKLVKISVLKFSSGTSSYTVVSGNTWTVTNLNSTTANQIKDVSGTNYCTCKTAHDAGMTSLTDPVPVTGTAYDAVLTGGGGVWYRGSAPNYDSLGRVRLMGLTPGKNLKIKLFMGVSTSLEREGRYRIAATAVSNWQNLNAKNNIANTIVFENNIVPASGQVDIEFSAATPSLAAVIQIIEIEES